MSVIYFNEFVTTGIFINDYKKVEKFKINKFKCLFEKTYDLECVLTLFINDDFDIIELIKSIHINLYIINDFNSNIYESSYFKAIKYDDRCVLLFKRIYDVDLFKYYLKVWIYEYILLTSTKNNGLLCYSNSNDNIKYEIYKDNVLNYHMIKINMVDAYYNFKYVKDVINDINDIVIVNGSFSFTNFNEFMFYIYLENDMSLRELKNKLINCRCDIFKPVIKQQEEQSNAGKLINFLNN